MLPKKQRLNLLDFNLNPDRVKKYFSIWYTILKKQGSSDISKIGIIVPKSVDKRSTKRNYSRRIVSEITQKNIKFMKKSNDIIIKLKKTVTPDNREKIKEDLIKYLKNDQL